MNIKQILKSLIWVLLTISVVTSPILAAEPIKIGLNQELTGYWEIYGKQEVTGFQLGLEYATKGTNKIIGRDVKVIIEDNQQSPARAKMLLTKLYNDDKVDIAIGPTSSYVAIPMVSVAKEFKKILILEGAAADSLTGSLWNPYLFRTAWSTSQQAISAAKAIAKPGISIAAIAPDFAYGREFIDAFKPAVEKFGAKIVHVEFCDPKGTDFTAPIQKLIQALKDKPSPKYMYAFWQGKPDPVLQMIASGLEKYDIQIRRGGHVLDYLKMYKPLKGIIGACYYYYEIPKNPINDWLVKEHMKRFNTPPDWFTCGGFNAAMAVVTGIQKAGSTDSEKLISAMEGMEFMTPKGKMIFRKEDHQALQSAYMFRFEVKPDVEWAIPVLLHEFTPEETAPPITVKR
jgi:branched-chain amino acid transport system substrate-binding protein